MALAGFTGMFTIRIPLYMYLPYAFAQMMVTQMNYETIDAVKTGRHLERCIRSAGMSVAQIQKTLMLRYPQSVYRWFKGEILPSVNNLYMLSKLLGMHMENLLIMEPLGDDTAGNEDLDELFIFESEVRDLAFWLRMDGRLFGAEAF